MAFQFGNAAQVQGGVTQALDFFRNARTAPPEVPLTPQTPEVPLHTNVETNFAAPVEMPQRQFIEVPNPHVVEVPQLEGGARVDNLIAKLKGSVNQGRLQQNLNQLQGALANAAQGGQVTVPEQIIVAPRAEAAAQQAAQVVPQQSAEGMKIGDRLLARLGRQAPNFTNATTVGTNLPGLFTRGPVAPQVVEGGAATANVEKVGDRLLSKLSGLRMAAPELTRAAEVTTRVAPEAPQTLKGVLEIASKLRLRP